MNLYILVLGCLCLISCEEDSKKVREASKQRVSGSSKGFLQTSDLSPVSPVPSSSVRTIQDYLLENQSFFYAIAPKTGLTLTGNAEACVGAKVDNILVKASPRIAEMSETLDISDCIKSDWLTDGITGDIQATMKYFYQTICTEYSDFEKFNGWTNKKFSESVIESICPSLTIYQNTQTDITGQIEFLATDGGSVKGNIFSHDLSYIGTPELGGCAYLYGETLESVEDNCTWIKKSTYRMESSEYEVDPPTSSFVSFRLTGVASLRDSTDPWYTQGVVNVVMDNWSGQVTYSDSKRAPAYGLSNGSETISGTMDSIPSGSAPALTTVKSDGDKEDPRSRLSSILKAMRDKYIVRPGQTRFHP